MKEIGIYIHIPFCVQKCYYCDFISVANKENLQERYVEALKKEINNFNSEKTKISTIYIGGGTPSYIKEKYIEEILNTIKSKWKLKKENDIEITIEVNPGTINKEKMLKYKEAGINRLSIGLQSTNNRLLKEIGRIHTYEQFLETFNTAKNIGLENINVDLMIGLPNQTIKDLKDSLKKIINLKPEHISTYSLILEEGTQLYKMVEEGKIELPDEDTERNMYWYVKNILELNGYNHYEISNFAKKGKESCHNMDCWSQKEYIGFGLAAHSYINNRRISNITNIDEYIKNIEENKFHKNKEIEEVQNQEIKQKEFMMLGLRKIEGISIQEFKNKFGENPIYIFRNSLKKLVEQNLLEIVEDKIKLTNKGLDFANLVWEEFI